jgi:hypothetical protein
MAQLARRWWLAVGLRLVDLGINIYQICFYEQKSIDIAAGDREQN